MAQPPIPTAFSAFNARHLDPRQVAQSFIPSRHFQTLAKHAHSFVVGPRGSGKTTLLKMLHPAALEHWVHDVADDYRDEIQFAGVFIPADLTWNQQLRYLEPSTPNEMAPPLAYSAFTTHLLHSLVRTMHYRTRSLPGPHEMPLLRCPITADSESELVAELCAAWRINTIMPTLSSLQNALLRRLIEIHSIGRSEVSRKYDNGTECEKSFVQLDMLASAVCGIEAFDNVLNTSSKWAFLFDELELAPRWVLDSLVRAVRNADPRILFKLSLSPYMQTPEQLDSVFAALPTHDFDPIRLWFAKKEEGYSFSRELVQSLVTSAIGQERTVEQVFGTSTLETASQEWSDSGTAYVPGSKQARHFTSLYQKDKSFKKHCDDNGIDPTFETVPEGDERAEIVRKIVSLVVVRDYHRASEDASSSRGKRRSRKSAELYGGATGIYAVSEGNPRWMKAIVTPLLESVAASGRRTAISAKRQGAEIARARQRFQALLRNIPSPPTIGINTSHGVMSLIDRIGSYFQYEVIEAPFATEPALSFVVDVDLPLDLIEAVGKALNAGGVIWVQDDAGEPFLRSVCGKRFRLAYLLATQFGLPPVLGNSVSLGHILSRSRTNSPSLFSEE